MNASDGYHVVITPGGTPTTLAGRYQITNKNSGLALDTLNAGAAQGTSVVQATSTTGTDRNWTLVASGSGLYKIVPEERPAAGHQQHEHQQWRPALIRGDNGSADHLWKLTSR